MRFSFVTLLMLAAAVVGAQTTQPATIAQDATQPTSEFPLMALDIPGQIVDGWSVRGNPEEEAAELQAFLRALIWGINGEADALASGRLIEVDPTGVILMRETPENIQRIRRQVDPSLQTVLRERLLSDSTGQRVTTGTMSISPDAGQEMLIRAANRPPEPAQGFGTASSSGGGSVARMSLHQDDDRYWRGIRITLLDVYEDVDAERLVAVLTVDTEDRSTEIEIVERRSEIVDNFRIRFLEGDTSPTISAVLEVTDLVASSR